LDQNKNICDKLKRAQNKRAIFRTLKQTKNERVLVIFALMYT